MVIGRRSWTEHFISSVVWSQYKKTTAVEVVGELIYGQLVLFPRLNDLTLRDFSGMDYADNYVPESLKRLTIINEKKLKDCELRELLLQSKHSLEHLYLGSETFYFTQLEFNFSRLKSLILVNHAIETVVDPLSPVLEKLHLEVLYNPFNLYINWTSLKGLPITSLTLGKWDDERSEMAKSCPNLKHLRILGETFPEHKEEIESLNLESVDVYYLDIPETQDLMLNMLDDDCLLVIMEHLNIEELATLCQVHSRFGKILGQRPKRTLRLDLCFMRRHPPKENQGFYHCLGWLVNDLDVTSYGTDVVEHFQQLDSLKISGYHLQNDKDTAPNIQPGLRCLEVICGAYKDLSDASLISEMFKRLNPTLRTLKIIESKVIAENLKELTNVTNLSLCDFEMTAAAFQFLRQNKDTIETLTLRDLVADVGTIGITAAVTEMKSLKELILEDMKFGLFVFGQPVYPQLHELVITAGCFPLRLLLQGLEVPKLRALRLNLKGNKNAFGIVLKERMPQLEELSIEGGHGIEFIVEEVLQGPHNLKTLRVETMRIYGRLMVDLVKGLPKLTSLHIGCCPPLLGRLHSYLKESERQVELIDTSEFCSDDTSDSD